MTHQGVLAHYKEFLPLTADTPLISLGEGDTPLVRAPALEAETGCEVWLKLEGCNPSGSFKDRGMVVAIAKAMEAKSRAVICASTGNTSASAAAYAARAGLECVVVIPEGKITQSKLGQAVVHNAKIIAVEGNFDTALGFVRELSASHPITLVNSVNPFRIEGQKTAAFEVVDVLGDAPDILALPVGNAGNITAYWKGFKEYHAAGRATKRPKMAGFEAEGSAAIVRGAPIEKPETIASAIRIGNPASWRLAVAARDESGGRIGSVTDDEILAAYRFLAAREGLFCEPSSAAGVAGILKMARAGELAKGQRIVCVLTGSGLKDPDMTMLEHRPIIHTNADYDAFMRAVLA
ncbi:MAG: threonine synthase [Chloroflexi bacterium]|nr:threonine synthase [Chloroflexota bacterium]